MSARLISAAGFFLAILTAFGVVLWNLQVVSGAAYYERSQRSIARVETVPAARGKLLDRNGKILAQDAVTWRADLEEHCDEAVLRRLKILCQEEEVTWTGEGSIEPVTSRLMARIREEGLTGISFTPRVTRSGSGDLAPHLLGRVGAMSPEEWEVYQEAGYPMDAQVGKDGAEAAFESLLHGTPGTKVLETDRNGQVTGESYSVTPQPGRDVTLTLDKDLQAAARAALQSFLDRHPQATGGAAVALDVSDGGVLAMVSLPDYDTAAFSADYETLSRDPDTPLMNRVVQGLYAPGSAFKLVTAAAALEEGCLTPETQILDTGRYTYYKSPQPQCWLYRQEGRTHGLETLSEAIADSCNIFFYDAGRRVGIETLDRYARALGLGVKTGIELAGEKAGVVAGPDYTASVGGTWYEGSVLSAAIGQENNRFTPLQLAHMTATLVSGGERRQVHILKKTEGEGPYETVTLGKLEISPQNLAAIKAGMGAVTRSGSLAAAFRDLPVEAGAKTGSAQVAGAELANAVLVCFAPYDDPQIALAIVVEQGGSGSALGETAAAILKEYLS
ncbi:MAG: penicillin-binding transpeptidase domain-containing protein [Bacillota bacterium]|nr:penicillin-binding transpeptidase domain-containing protein [Bacillota bacterium]